MGAPAFISFPHFYNADEVLLQAVDGLLPSSDRHAFAMELIPVSQVPMCLIIS